MQVDTTSVWQHSSRTLPRRRAAPLLPRLLPHRVALLRPRRSAAAFQHTPTALLLRRRSSTLPRCSASRRSASLCYMHRRLAAAALLRCCRAASLLPLHSASSFRMRLNQSLLGGLGAFPKHARHHVLRWRASLQHPSRGAFAALVLGPHITILLVSRGPFCTHSWATRDGETSQENGDLHS